MKNKRTSHTTPPAPKAQSLKDIFPGKQSDAFRDAFQQLKTDVKTFQKTYADNIAEQDGASLRQAFKDFENILQQAQKIRSYTDMRSLTVEKKPSWAKNTKKRLNTILRDTLFFASEISALPEHELLDRMAEEPKLSQYTPWLRQVRSYNGTTFDTESEQYINDQMHTHHDIKNIWAELAAPVTEDDGNLFQNILTEDDSNMRHEIFETMAETAAGDEDILLQLLSNRMRGHDTFAEMRGFDTPDEAYIAFSQTSPTALEAMKDGLSDKVASLSAKFYKRKAQMANTPRLHPADMLHIHTPDIAANSWDKDVLPALEKLYPQNTKTPKILNGTIGKKLRSPYTPFKLFTPADNTESYLCLDDDSGKTLKTLLYTAQGYGTAASRQSARDKNSVLTEKTLPVFQKVAGFVAEQHAMDILIKKERNLENKRDLIAFQIERQLQSLALHLSLTEFDANIHKFAEKNDSLQPEDAQKIWKGAMQHYFGSAIDYDTPGTDMLWSQWPTTFSDISSIYQDIFGISLSAQIQQDYTHARNKNAAADKFHDFLSAGSTKQGKALLSTLGLKIDDPDMWENSMSLLEKRFETLQDLDRRIAAKANNTQKPPTNPPKKKP